jgi:hypothetical protein
MRAIWVAPVVALPIWGLAACAAYDGSDGYPAYAYDTDYAYGPDYPYGFYGGFGFFDDFDFHRHHDRDRHDHKDHHRDGENFHRLDNHSPGGSGVHRLENDHRFAQSRTHLQGPRPIRPPMWFQGGKSVPLTRASGNSAWQDSGISSSDLRYAL